MKIRKIVLILILLLAAFLRIWMLGSVPPATSNDEASIGYNAYSVSKIGVDEYGKFPLISQRAYDDWRRSTYLLFVVPFVSVGGLNSIPIRLPAVLLSLLTVLATYYIVLSLFRKHSPISEITALSASFFVAVSPWHMYISRIGHESNVYESFFVFGMLFFLTGIRDYRKTLVSIVCFAVSMIGYYAGQVIVPLTAIGLLIIYWKDLLHLLTSDKRALIGFSVLIVLLIPISWSLFSPDAMIRFRGTTTFDPSAHQQLYADLVNRRNDAVSHHDIVGSVIYNRRLFPLIVFSQGYISHFSPAWLFSNSGREAFKISHMGVLSLFELPFILVGILAFLFHKEVDSRAKKVIILWFLLAAVPASIATQAPHAMRAYAFIPVWQIFAAFGLSYILIHTKKFRVVVVPVILLAGSIYLGYLCANYFVVFPREQSDSFYYAASKAIPYVLTQSYKYDKVVFSNTDNLYQSYMDFLYYSRYDPALYQKQGGTKSGGFAETHRIGKYEFRPIHWQKEVHDGKTLYVGTVTDFPEGSHMATFDNLDGTPAVVVGV